LERGEEFSSVTLLSENEGKTGRGMKFCALCWYGLEGKFIGERIVENGNGAFTVYECQFS